MQGFYYVAVVIGCEYGSSTSTVCELALVIRLREEVGRGSLDYTVNEFLGCTKCEEFLGHTRDCDVLGGDVYRRIYFFMKVAACW